MPEQITRAVRRRRLTAYYEFMQGIKAEKVYLGAVTRNFEKGEPTCGSVGCVMGWAPAVPVLAKAGLFWERSGDMPDPRTKNIRNPSDAVGTVLGLHAEDRDWVFDSYSDSDDILAARYKTSGKKDTDKQRAVNRLRFLLELDDMGVLPMLNDATGFFDPERGAMSDMWMNPKFKGIVRAY